MSGYFKHIPNIGYDFKSDGNIAVAKDLFKKVQIFPYLQQSISGYEYYQVMDGERPDILANKLYGDSTLYWTLTYPQTAAALNWNTGAESESDNTNYYYKSYSVENPKQFFSN